MRADGTDLAVAFVIVILISVIAGGYMLMQVQSAVIEEGKNNYLLQSYQLETERKKAEAMLIHAKALELSCAAELVNEFGEVYKR